VVGDASGRIFLCLLDPKKSFRPMRYSQQRKLFSALGRSPLCSPLCDYLFAVEKIITAGLRTILLRVSSPPFTPPFTYLFTIAVIVVETTFAVLLPTLFRIGFPPRILVRLLPVDNLAHGFHLCGDRKFARFFADPYFLSITSLTLSALSPSYPLLTGERLS
jgi:hypothetical protein